ncbi:MAG: hypothetical protein C4332_15085, partial [Meiothermus sp.]
KGIPHAFFKWANKCKISVKQDLALHIAETQASLRKQLDKVQFMITYGDDSLAWSQQTSATVYVKPDGGEDVLKVLTFSPKGGPESIVGQTKYAGGIKLDRKNSTAQAFLRWLGIL